MSKNMTPAQLANLRKPWAKGECGNPTNKNNHGRPKNRATELHKQLLGQKAAKKFYGITNEELDTYDAMLETLTMAELQVLAKADDSPVYLKNYAIAILTDMKNGKTTTIDRIRENRHGKNKQTLEVTGADGQPLVQERNLTAEDVADIMHEYDEKYKGGTIASQPIGFKHNEPKDETQEDAPQD